MQLRCANCSRSVGVPIDPATDLCLWCLIDNLRADLEKTQAEVAAGAKMLAKQTDLARKAEIELETEKKKNEHIKSELIHAVAEAARAVCGLVTPEAEQVRTLAISCERLYNAIQDNYRNERLKEEVAYLRQEIGIILGG